HNSIHSDHHHQDMGTIKVFGFWIYLMSDCILFAALLATYAVLVNGIADGPSGKDIFDLRFVLIETFLLLLSSITYGIAMLGIN
ncbi:MAG: cytochrome o ubiquinol oxidase subunit III, partial [Candidatus Regiella insecticola]|nr:cytochrome o ubiquinol oxidase subunit III [Candidatus Regiella insecticola]